MLDITSYYSECEGFKSLYGKAGMLSSCPEKDLHALYHYVIYSNFIEGDLAEAGVFRGGSAYLIAAASYEHKILHLFDSFAGIPEPGPQDKPAFQEGVGEHKRAGRFRGDLPSVKRVLRQFGKRVVFHRGFFEHTLKNPALSDIQYALVHIDVDLYESARQCLEYFYPRLSVGGVMVIHDYKFCYTPGIERAVTEYFNGCLENKDRDCYRNMIQLAIIRRV